MGVAVTSNFVRFLLCAMFALALTGCGATYRDKNQVMMAQADVKLSRYLGTWYEIARFPVPFQRGCTATTATYGAIDDATVSVHNKCRQQSPDGPLREIKGTARVSGPGQLRVRFSSIPLISAPYWILWVDDSYETAVVGVPNGRAGWILARTPDISPARRQFAEAVLRKNGYDTSDLLTVEHAR